jgi:phytoene dehydrogenase-like protein
LWADSPASGVPVQDVVVIGSGPNGLAAAITMARSGASVLVLEADTEIGGGARTAELTLPGFLHDVCSAVHPMAIGSPFFSDLSLADHGLSWIQPSIALAHALENGGVIVLDRSVEATARGLERDDDAYRRLMAPLVVDWTRLAQDLLAPPRWPRHPLALARFGLLGLRSARGLVESRFRTERARTLFAGLAAHSMLPLDRPLSAAFALVLAMAGHAVGWPMPRGGSRAISRALASVLLSLGGRIETGRRVQSLAELHGVRTVLCDLTPRQLLELAGPGLASGERRALSRFRHGPGVWKVDWALDAPIPWRAEALERTGTVHLGSWRDIQESLAAVARGESPERPFVILAQPSRFDPMRAPAGKHTAWAYCHVPNGSRTDVTDRIEAQIERCAPGFTRRILARCKMSPADFERHNANLVGGDIGGGANDLRQFLLRPTRRLYRTSLPGVYLCSASTPPGAGVHGMCGYFAARQALRDRARTRSGGHRDADLTIERIAPGSAPGSGVSSNTP